MIRKKYGKSITGIVAILTLPFLSQTTVEAQGPQEKAMPGIQLLLLSKAPQPNIAFVTSLGYDGNLGGLEGADQKCQALATAAGLPLNTYKAWLSTSTVNAIDRLGTARGWVRVDGKPFADTKADIVAGKIFHPLRVDENGNFDNQVWGSKVWTGTYGDGTVNSSATCNDWISADSTLSGSEGHDDGVTSAYTWTGTSGCNYNTPRLYCFGVDKNAPVTVTPVVGRIAFHTRNSWIPSGGLASADQLCMDEAGAAGLSGSFKALLATDGASAASRFNTNGLPWVRPDGVSIAPTAAALFSAEFLDTAISQSADGLQYFGYYGVWTGALYPDTAGAASTTCNNWASNSSLDYARTGISGFTSQGNFGRISIKCNATWNKLYCLQE